MPEKKGPARNNVQANKEDDQLGPYPCWDRWKPALLKQVGEDNFDQFDPEIRDLLHRTYVIRRKTQLHENTVDDVEQARQLEEKLGGIDKIRSNPKVNFALDFIYSRVKP